MSLLPRWQGLGARRDGTRVAPRGVVGAWGGASRTGRERALPLYAPSHEHVGSGMVVLASKDVVERRRRDVPASDPPYWTPYELSSRARLTPASAQRRGDACIPADRCETGAKSSGVGPEYGPRICIPTGGPPPGDARNRGRRMIRHRRDRDPAALEVCALLAIHPDTRSHRLGR